VAESQKERLVPISLIVFSFISILGALAGTALLTYYLGLFEVANPVLVWFEYWVFSFVGILTYTHQPRRLLILLGLWLTVLGLVAIGTVFVASLGIALTSVSIWPLVLLAALTLFDGFGLIVAGRASDAQE
jgi:hypothetical protein